MTRSPSDDRATARLNAGTAAYHRGDYMRGRREMERAFALFRAQYGADDSRTLRALSDLGVMQAALGDHAASRATHEAALQGRRRTLGETHQDVGTSLHNLAQSCAALGEEVLSADYYLQAVTIWRATLGETHPAIAPALANLAVLTLRRGDPQTAIGYARGALHIQREDFPPDHAAIAYSLDRLAYAQVAAGEESAAQASWHQALGLPGLPEADAAEVLVKIGQSRRRLGDLAGANACFEAAVKADGTLIAARHNLAASLTRLGRAGDARPHLTAALKEERIFVQPGPENAPRVLILASATEGNIPLDHLLPERDFTRIWWFIDYAPDPGREALPPHDVVFNALGDPDAMEGVDVNVLAFLGNNGKTLLNHPASVARTRRDRLPALLAGINGLVVPRVCRIAGTPASAAIMRAAEEAGIAPPLLLRPAGAHGGTGVRRIETWEDFGSPSAPAWYATSFHDCRRADGYTRKYRIIFVDRIPYAYHLAISRDWLVHYFSADMVGQDWKLAEEAAFLADPAGTLGAAAFAALHEAGARMDLDYCGMDFGVADGRIVVFEANATMLVHPEREPGPLGFKNPAVSRIVVAMDRRVKIGGDVADVYVSPPQTPND